MSKKVSKISVMVEYQEVKKKKASKVSIMVEYGPYVAPPVTGRKYGPAVQ